MDSLDWGYVLVGKDRPERSAQMRVMKYAGCDVSEVGTVWVDTLPPRATRPMSALTERSLLISTTQAGDRVHFATLMCVGVSGDDARAVLEALAERDVTAVVHEGMREIGPGADLDLVAADFDRMRNTAQVRRSRQKNKPSGKV